MPSSFLTQEINVDVLANWKFLDNFLDMRREKFSQIHICERENEIHNPIVSSHREEGSKKALVILAKTALYDTLHHCDVCKFYREGIATTSSKTYTYQLDVAGEQIEKVTLKIVIPPIHSKYFDVDDEAGCVERLTLSQYEGPTPVISAVSPNKVHMVRSPILMMSTVGEEEGLSSFFSSYNLNLNLHVSNQPFRRN